MINTDSESLLSYLLFLLSVQLLHKLSVRAADGPQRLLRMIKNPVSDHLPAGCPRYATSFKAGDSVCPRTLVPKEGPAVVVIGAFAHGAVGLSSHLLGQWFSKHYSESLTGLVIVTQRKYEAKNVDWLGGSEDWFGNHCTISLLCLSIYISIHTYR